MLNKRNLVATLERQSGLYYAALLLITVFAAGLRLFRLAEWSFWIDEIYTLNHAINHFSRPELILANIPPYRNWLPVSVILTAQVVHSWGISEWSARLTSVVIGTLSIPILYAPTKRIWGPRLALAAMLLLAVSPWHIFWSQNARFYASMMLFYTLALFYFYLGIEEDKLKYLFLFLIVVYLAASERISALLIFPVIVSYLVALWVLKFEKPKGLNLRNIVIVALPILIGSVVEVFTRIVSGESRFFADFSWFLQYQIDDPFRLLVFIGNNIGMPLMIMAGFSGLFLLRQRSRPGLLMLVSAVVPLILLLIASTLIFTKDRYMFVTLFSWILLTVVGIGEIASRLKGNFGWLALGIFLVFFFHALNDMVMYYQANHGNRLQWKSAFSTVKARADNDDVIVSFWPEFGPYYLDREIIPYTDVQVRSMLEGRQKYWFVLDSETIWLNANLKSWLENNAELIDVWYLRRPEDNFLRVYLFDPVQIEGSE